MEEDTTNPEQETTDEEREDALIGELLTTKVSIINDALDKTITPYVAVILSLESAHESWVPVITGLLAVLKRLLRNMRKENISYIPSKWDMAAPFIFTRLDELRVVILGQDPYHQPENPMGLAFSVRKGVPIPASLKNIFTAAIACKAMSGMPNNGSLIPWALQGVFLLNVALTVEPHAPGTHITQWKQFTIPLIKAIAATKKNVIFVLWGAPAQQMRKHCELDNYRGNNHVFLEGPHPVARGGEYLGCTHLKEINDIFIGRKEAPIKWDL
jgi:uracil-DNA glycosylase